MGLYLGSFRTIGDARAADVAVVDGFGNQLTGFDSSRPATATLTSVASSAVSVVLLASNAVRRRFIIVNDSTKLLYVALAATASATAFSIPIAKEGVYESPLNDYTGVISGIWTSANGFARVTEITT
mgnify:FL=1